MIEHMYVGVSVPTDYQVVDEDKHQPSYIELRAEAALHAKLRAECFMKAAHARSKKQYEVAQYYAQQVSGCVCGRGQRMINFVNFMYRVIFTQRN